MPPCTEKQVCVSKFGATRGHGHGEDPLPFRSFRGWSKYGIAFILIKASYLAALTYKLNYVWLAYLMTSTIVFFFCFFFFVMLFVAGTLVERWYVSMAKKLPNHVRRLPSNIWQKREESLVHYFMSGSKIGRKGLIVHERQEKPGNSVELITCMYLSSRGSNYYWK